MDRLLHFCLLLCLPGNGGAQTAEPPNTYPASETKIYKFMAAIPLLDEVPYELDRRVLRNRSPLHRSQMIDPTFSISELSNAT